MKLLEQNETVKIEYDEASSLFKHTWNDNTSDLDDDLYKENVLFVNKWVSKVKADFHLVDTSQFRFVIPPEVQEWVANIVFPELATQQVKKLAFLVTSDVFAQVSIEQFVEENRVADVKVMYFEDEKSALAWLFDVEIPKLEQA